MGIAERKKREKEKRRADILEAAQRLFFSRTFEEVSMDEIAKEVELNKATLYLYFKNKEDLYATIVLQGIEILKAKYKHCMDTDAPGIVKVALMGQAYFQFSQEYPEYLRMIHFYGSERFSKENPCNADIGKGYGICRLILRDAVQLGIDDGSIRSDLDPFLTSMYLMISFMNNLSMEAKWKLVIEAEGFSFNQYASEVFRFIIPSIISKEKATSLDIRDFAKYGFNLSDNITI